MSLSAFFDHEPDDLEKIIETSQYILAESLTSKYQEDYSTFVKKMKQKKNKIYVNI
ncbi:MAG: hypothetical protein OCC45_10630 [Desulfotalea sp.]